VIKRILFCLFVIFLSAVVFAKQEADRIFINSKIWTGQFSEPWAEAFAVKDGLFLEVGSNEAVEALRGEQTEVTDLQGRFVAPGFIDAHMHFLTPPRVELDESDSLDIILKKMKEFAEAHASSAWISGMGWGYASFPDRKPDKKYLDDVIQDRPVFLQERDGHMGLANSRALELAGITKDTPDPGQGRIIHDSNGELTGELQESAMDLVEKLIPPATPDELYSNLKTLLDRAASYGLTSVQNATYDEDRLPVIRRALKEGGLKLRFYWAVPFRKDATLQDLKQYKALSDLYPPQFVKFGAAKGFLDGVVDAQTAAMFEPYTTGKNGLAMWTQEDLNRTAAFYDKHGFQIMLHAIGDKAIAMALNAYEYVRKANPPRDRRDRVEHLEVPRLSDLIRFRELGVIASTQALFANPDKTTLENYAPLLGPQRASHANAFKLIDDAGVVQAFGSDWPVFSMEVLRGIYCAVARETAEGTPPGGWYPENRISVEAALRHFTKDAAYASFDEKVKGTISKGKYADFVVLSDNILNPPAERILKTKVLMTFMNGKQTWGE
jgi:predicted amidohydrolase YtcJ